jgi:uncharacterized membrane protein (UPF0127 family)
MRRLVVVAIIIVAIVLVSAAYLLFGSPASVTGTVPSKFTVNGKTFTFTYVATDQASREAGLMNKKVTNITTMLFAFPSAGDYRFWMYNTNTSLDMIWINAQSNTGTVVFVVLGAQPCYNQFTCPTYGSSNLANYVIEAKAGFITAYGIQDGATVLFS